MNFNRKGEAGTLLNSLYLFYNAGVQGTARMMRAVNTRSGRRAALGVVAFGALMGTLNSLLSDEDDDGELYYDKLSDWERANNFILMLPGTDGRYIKFPLPYGYNVLYAFGNHAASLGRGKQDVGDFTGNVLASAINSFNPLGGDLSFRTLVPEVGKPAHDIVYNQDFMGRQIRPTRFPSDYRPDSELYYPNVNPVMKAAADALNRITGGDEVRPGAVSLYPDNIDYFFDWLTGSAGRFVKEAIIEVPSTLLTDKRSRWRTRRSCAGLPDSRARGGIGRTSGRTTTNSVRFARSSGSISRPATPRGLSGSASERA